MKKFEIEIFNKGKGFALFSNCLQSFRVFHNFEVCFPAVLLNKTDGHPEAGIFWLPVCTLLFDIIMKKTINILKYYFTFFLIPALLIIYTISCTTVADLPETGSYFSSKLDFDEVTEDGFVYFPETQIAIKTVYSKDSVSFWLKTSDEVTVASLLINGLSVWVDPDAGKSQNSGVIYPSASFSVIREQVERSKDPLKLEDDSDTLGFDISKLVKSINDRGAVIQMGHRARFAEKEQAVIFMENNRAINYVATLPFSALNITDVEGRKISIGVYSKNMPPPQQESQRPHGQVGPRDPRYPQDRYSPHRDQRTQQRQLKTIEAWMIIVLNEEKVENNI